MEYVKLGNTGLDVSRICLGCMSFGSTEADKLVVGRLAEVAYMEEPYAPHPIVGLIPYGAQ